MARHDEFDDFFGEDDDTPVVDTRADGRLLRVPLARIAPNLVNPRADFGTEDQLIDLGKSLARRQNQPCPVVSCSAYFKLWPDHREKIGDVDFVLVSGERRFRGATAVGLAALNCVVDDNVAADRKTFMEAVVSENVDRQNFDPIEEAFAVQALVAEFGSNRAVAQHFDRVDGWVTQRVLLTHLAREVQDLVRQKEMPLEVARSLGKLARDNAWSAAEQLAWWDQEQDRRAAATAARAAARKAARQPAEPSPAPSVPVGQVTPQQPSFTAVKQEPDLQPSPAAVRVSAPQPAAQGASAPVPVEQPTPQPGSDAGGENIPEQRASAVKEVQSAPAQPKRFPYENGVEAAHHLIIKMPPPELSRMLALLNQHQQTQAAQAG